MPNISMRQHLSLGCWAWLKHLDWKRSAFMSCKSNEVWDQVAIKSNSCKWGIRGVLGTRLTEFIFQAAQSDSDRQTDGRKNGHMDALHIASDTRHHTNNIKICVCVCINIYIYIYSTYIILYRHHPALMKPGCHLALTNPIMICIYICKAQPLLSMETGAKLSRKKRNDSKWHRPLETWPQHHVAGGSIQRL